MIRYLLLFALSVTSLWGCALKDGEMQPSDRVFRIVENGVAVEANHYALQIPATGGTFVYELEYEGNPCATLHHGSDGGLGLYVDGFSVCLLDDAKVDGIVSRQNSTVVKQSLEVSVEPNECLLRKKMSFIITCMFGEAEMYIIQHGK